VTWLGLAALALWIVPVLVLVRWYNGRIREVNEAQREQNRTMVDVWTDPTPLERQVNREAWLAIAGVLAYWGLLSLIF